LLKVHSLELGLTVAIAMLARFDHTFFVFQRPLLNSAAPATAYVENAIASAE
jgi:hypothetical protein